MGGPVRAPGDPGRLLAAPAPAAAQGVCGNDTARAAEIPPPDIGWKVEQLVRDNQWRSIAAGGRRGGGATGQARGTPAEATSPPPARGHAGPRGPAPGPPLWVPRPQRSRLGPRSRNAQQQCLTRHGTTWSEKWLAWIHVQRGPDRHNNDQRSPRTRTQHRAHRIPLDGLSPTTAVS